MALDLLPSTPIDYFASLVHSDGDFALFEAAVSIAQDEYPELDVQAVLLEVDQLMARIRRQVPADAMPLQKLRIFNQFFFHDLNFGCNLNDYYDPDNSFIHCVLRTRKGIPISLALLWMELAQGLGLSVRGISFPGHFMVRVSLPLGQVVIDPVDGRSLSREDLSLRLEPFSRRAAPANSFEAPLGFYLQAASPRAIIGRMLRNLKELHGRQQDWHRLLAVQERIVVLQPEAWSEYRDRGLTHAALGNNRQALADLECYLVHAEEDVDLDAIAEQVDALRRAEL
ncbi:MAG: tetratricopeptide repeat protein [Rhodoferax sp.]|nr:tetratricopeptide repeat protein [Rhodoferax sp.]MCF8209835.1 tetratricopeptide repeat protein [Rhodoferax sp.]